MGGEGFAGAFAIILMTIISTVGAIKAGGALIVFAAIFWFVILSCIASMVIDHFEGDN